MNPPLNVLFIKWKNRAVASKSKSLTNICQSKCCKNLRFKVYRKLGLLKEVLDCFLRNKRRLEIIHQPHLRRTLTCSWRNNCLESKLWKIGWLSNSRNPTENSDSRKSLKNLRSSTLNRWSTQDCNDNIRSIWVSIFWSQRLYTNN